MVLSLSQEDESSMESLGGFLNGGGGSAVLWVTGSDKDPLRLTQAPPILPLKKRGIYLMRLGEEKLEASEVGGRVIMGDLSASTPVLDQILRATQEV
jgi:hypothetical protein